MTSLAPHPKEISMFTRFAALLVAALSVTVGCARPSPCERLAPPTRQELDLAASGVEIERKVGRVECELEDGRWEEDGDDSARPKPAKTPKPTTPKTATR